MKKYMTPDLSELLFEDVLMNSNEDNVTEDPVAGDNYDEEDGWGTSSAAMIAD